MENFSFKGYDIPVHLVIATGAGPETFEAISKSHMTLLDKYVGIKQGDTVVEIGCGIGRDAIPLIDVIGATGRYFGIDVISQSIDWCKSNIGARNANFQFRHDDIKDALHNPNGTLLASDIRIDCEDGSVDAIILQSVFTHMFAEEIAHYFNEFSRILKSDGKIWATCFIVDDQMLDLIANSPKSEYELHFRHAYGEGCWVNWLDQPRGAVAFSFEKLAELVQDAKLSFSCPVIWGTWSGLRKNTDCGQDAVVLRRR